MEPRIAALEVKVDHVQADLAKLSTVPVDVAAIKASMVTQQGLSSALNTHFMAMCAATAAIVAVVGLVLHFA